MLVIRGEPGIGKTALLRYALEHAEGMAVLSAGGVESEAEVPFAGLLELLRPAFGELEHIPPPQADALSGALALGPRLESDRFMIGAATLSLLAAYAERAPLLITVDDAHWLDNSSVTALVFAMRRLLAESIAVLLSVRKGEAPAIEGAGLPQHTLEGLDAETAAALVSRHAERPLPAGVVDSLYRTTGGNPLALVELAARPADRTDAWGAGHPPAETSVERAYQRRIAALSEGAQRALLVAATDDSGSFATIEAAAESLGIELAALEEAERVELVSAGYGLLRFRHPLVRAAAYHAAAPAERRAAHRAIAAALDESSEGDRRAWHLASAAFGTDESVAAALERVGEGARQRSAYAASATAFERAAGLTRERTDRVRRLFAAGQAAWLSGQAERAMLALEQALGCCSDPLLRAEIEHLRGHVAMRAGTVMAGHAILVAAASEIVASDPAKAVMMLAEAADACVYAARPGTMLQTAERAREALPSDAGEREEFFASLALGTALIYNGQGNSGATLVRRALSVLESSDALATDPGALLSGAIGRLWLREAGTSWALADRAIESARARGAIGVLPFALVMAGRDAAASDRWSLGEALYGEAIHLARETGQATALCAGLSWLAGIEARTGHEEACRRHAAEALALCDRHGLGFFRLWTLDALADLELGLGRPDAAMATLAQRQERLREAGIADPDVSAVPQLVEASVRAGRTAEVLGPLEEFAAQAERKAQPWALAKLERCRGLLAEEPQLEHHFGEALRLHELTPDRFEEALTRLCHGERLRRTRHRLQARSELRRALQAFDELGAAPWAERAALELRATGETARRRDPSTLDQLTPQELQIALVLAEGATTREAATRLFLSPKTIEYHLRNVYRKLGVRSRDALAQAVAVRAAAAPDEPAVGAPRADRAATPLSAS